ncbi:MULTISPECIES: GntR family transcriptional regulator [Shinella]|jgi:GntR family colanic acid and biofilm gene transcriptional regulator|uniref:GntR family transcriptional regulator n=1 Tax=Shinella granuli TaxID=323621 RepID=A0A4R2CZY7_SHIGR|nr:MULTISPECIES: GntR family transcriptional regulator [Shinella]ANH07636.1 GntR family transcriptional regulator [Shinella sp. HZN7]TCN44994.1 GntR family transcriptional regulator [Shinella granuli]
MSVMEMQPGEVGSLSARIYTKVREGLIVGNFAPGDRLLMQDLAEQLGTSVTPVREACLRLVSEQALELRSGRFVTVPDLSRARYIQIKLIRMALEGLAAEHAADHVTAADLAQLEAFHAAFVKNEKAGNLEAARSSNRAFHFGVYRLSRMPMLVGQIESMWVSMGPILNVYYREIPHNYTGAEEHVHLIEALRAGDKKKARQAIENDIQRASPSLLRYFEERGAA